MQATNDSGPVLRAVALVSPLRAQRRITGLQSSTAKPSSTDMPNISSACIESADIRKLPHSLSFVHVLSTAVYQTCSQCSPAQHGDSSEGLNSGPLQSLSTFLSLSSLVICQDKQPILYLTGLLLR